ncbi:MAG TPA: peptide ABC transporter substrate-binding protein [Candidatus Baltobacteraceae bacterium]
MTRSALPFVLALAILVGCAHVGSSSAPADTLRIAQQREPRALNPALENGVSAMEWGELIFQYLVKYDDSGRLVGDAATEVPTLANGGISPDGLTITYHLKPGLRFSDGAPLTAADCAFSVDAIMDPANNVQSRYGYDRIAKAEAPDPRTCVFHLKTPFAPLLTLVMAPQGFPILPKHLLARLPNFNDIPFDQLPVGSGPYRVVAWHRGDRVELVPNPLYYRGAPKIAHLTISFVADSNTAMNQLRTGESDGLFDDQSRGDYPYLKAIPGVVTTATPKNAVGAIIFNTADPVTSDARVRRALALALDVPAIVAKTYRGALDSRAAGRGLFIWAYDPQAYPDPAYDPARARALLDAAGWKRTAGGVREKNGMPLDILFVIQAATPGDAAIGSEVQQSLSAVGARVTLKAYEITQFVAPVAQGGPVYGGKFGMALYPFTNGDDPDTTDQFACKNVPPNGYNKSRICDPRIDALLDAGRTTYDTAKRQAAYSALQRELAAQMPLILTYQGRELNAFSTRLRNQTTSLSTAFWNVGAWTLAPR